LAIQAKADRVDAVALAGGCRAVLEDVSEVRPAAPAGHLGAHHAVAAIGVQVDRVRDRRLREAPPAGAGVELGVGPEELGATGGTAIDAVVVTADVLAGEGP